MPMGSGTVRGYRHMTFHLYQNHGQQVSKKRSRVVRQEARPRQLAAGTALEDNIGRKAYGN